MRALLLAVTCVSAVFANAAPSVDAVPAISPASTPSLLGVVQVLFALLLVLAAILASAWLLRRFGPGQFGSNAHMRVVSGVMVGQKERVVIVEVRDTWLVLGVTPAEISTLHTLKKPEEAPANTVPVTGNFAERLASALVSRRAAAHPAANDGNPI